LEYIAGILLLNYTKNINLQILFYAAPFKLLTQQQSCETFAEMDSKNNSTGAEHRNIQSHPLKVIFTGIWEP